MPKPTYMALTVEYVKNGNTYTLGHFLDRDSYDVNYEFIEDEWTDGNFTLHRDVFRRKIKGRFTLGSNDRANLRNALTEMGYDGYPNTQVTFRAISVNNSLQNYGVVNNVTCFIRATGAARVSNKLQRQWWTLELEIEEV